VADDFSRSCDYVGVLGFNLFGDGLRDALDPHLRGRRWWRPKCSSAQNFRLRETYDRIRAWVMSTTTWEGEDEVGGALALLMHNAYHLGEIRQTLCTIKPER
jgi:hypothetical protein